MTYEFMKNNGFQYWCRHGYDYDFVTYIHFRWGIMGWSGVKWVTQKYKRSCFIEITSTVSKS